jgi:hypothetical protein
VASLEPSNSVSVREIAFEAFGVRIGVRAEDARLWPRIAELIPPHARPCDGEDIEQRFSIGSEDAATWTVRQDVRDGVPARPIDVASWIATDVDLSLALGLLESHIHDTVAFRAPGRTFLRAGAVAHQGRMIVLPGPGLSGKSRLVAALVRAGATYYSDQFAVLDQRGLVHPYAAPLRVPGSASDRLSQDDDQAIVAGERPLPAGAIVLTSYLPGAEWRPRTPSQGEATLTLMSHAVTARERPGESMHTIRHLFDSDPVVIASDRDEAEPIASTLLASLDERFSAAS